MVTLTNTIESFVYCVIGIMQLSLCDYKIMCGF